LPAAFGVCGNAVASSTARIAQFVAILERVLLERRIMTHQV
jgi:hypothetical protein